MTKAPTARLDRLLGNLGYGSRNEIDRLAKAGRITLDGAALADASQRLALEPGLESRLRVNGEALDPLPGMILMLHKPLGVTCSHKEIGPLVYDLLPERWRLRATPLSTVGRLDKETSGLLLMTDDGNLLHRIIAPKAHVAKLYRATLETPLRGDEAELFASGTLMLEGETKPLLPVAMEIHSPTNVSLILTEGRYHQVRRMFAATGNHVVALHRDRVGALQLPDDLAAGEYRMLEPEDVAAIFAAAPVAA